MQKTTVKITKSQINSFQIKIRDYFSHSGRQFPWRETTDAYAVLVSEVMLQQTQVTRVLTKYKEFLNKFPDVNTLATASLAQVFEVWSGLGYNRRAKYLRESAEMINKNFAGKMPQTIAELITLPGISHATAAAICVYAFNQPAVFIETNIRTVFLHEFFKDKQGISDKEIMPLVATTLDQSNPRQWYWALMDYGTYLKKTFGNPNIRSKQYVKQSKFNGSNRQIRGLILKVLLEKCALTREQLAQLLERNIEQINANLQQMEKEGLISQISDRFVIKP